jgi:hypothetical protein
MSDNLKPNTRWEYFLADPGIPVKALLELENGEWVRALEGWTVNIETGELERTISGDLLASDCSDDNIISEDQFLQEIKDYLEMRRNSKTYKNKTVSP